MMKLLAIATLYKPDIPMLRKSLASYVGGVDKLLLWRNSPLDEDAILGGLEGSGKIEFCGDGGNAGIPKALNHALQYASQNGFTHILTMDQDSIWEDFGAYLDRVRALARKDVLYGPRINGTSGPFILTSGMIVPLEVAGATGGWDESFFVDGVDMEFMFHAKSLGFEVLKVEEGNLVHRLGDTRRKKFLGREYTVNNYPPERLRGLYQSHLAVLRRYGDVAEALLGPVFRRQNYRQRPLRILLGEKNKFRKFAAILKGIREGKRPATIGVEIKERLGNQLFRYAFARRLQIDRGGRDELVLGTSFFKGRNADEGWRCGLHDFRIAGCRESSRKLVYSEGSLIQKLLLGAFYLDIKFLRKPRSSGERYARQNAWTSRILGGRGLAVAYDNNTFPRIDGRRIFLEGSFENPLFFDGIRDTLLKELTPRKAPLAANEALYRAIGDRESVCVSVRRGDFLSEKFRPVFDVCSVNYYKKAMELMRGRLGNPLFVFFSDDIAWVRENLAGPGDLCESGSDPVWEKLRLMYSCKHFIISNSTFAWWAQYLGRNPDKIVVAPSRWYNDDRPQHLLQDSFIKIEP